MTLPPVCMESLQLRDVTHQLVQQFMAELSDLLDELPAGALAAPQRNLLAKIIDFFDEEMAEHHSREDERVFPRLLSGGDAVLAGKVRQLQADHVQLARGWAELKVWIDRLAASPGTDATAMRACFLGFSQRFASHLVLEESIQFSPDPQALSLRWDL